MYWLQKTRNQALSILAEQQPASFLNNEWPHEWVGAKCAKILSRHERKITSREMAENKN